MVTLLSGEGFPRAFRAQPPGDDTGAGHPSRSNSQATRLAELLAVKISEGRISAGERLPTESALMKLYGVGRNCIREAISYLQGRGLVTTRHGIGTFVMGSGEPIGPLRTSCQMQDLLALREMLIGIESEAAAMAAARRSPESLHAMRVALDDLQQSAHLGADGTQAEVRLHAELGHACQSVRIRELLVHAVSTLSPRWRANVARLSRGERAKRWLRLHSQFAEVVAAIEERDGEKAREAMRELLESRCVGSDPVRR